MNPWETSDEATQELIETGEIEILPDKADIRKYDDFVLKSDTKDQFIIKVKNEGWSEFTIGVLVGMQLHQEGKIKKKSRWLPEIFRSKTR